VDFVIEIEQEEWLDMPFNLWLVWFLNF
jgi:hypothetical protein